MSHVKITMVMEVPDDATKQDITDYIDVTLCEWGSMKTDNPCKDESDVTDVEWDYYQ